MRVVLQVGVLLLLTVVGSLGCESDPDQTNEKLYFYNCRAGDPVTANNIEFDNDDGSISYPVYMGSTLNLVLNITNSAKQTWDNIYFSADIYRYTDIFGFCSWLQIPTFGLLDHIDSCGIGANSLCPVPPGVTVFRDRIDITELAPIISIMSTSEPYRWTLTFSSGGTEIGCATVEGKITKDPSKFQKRLS